MTSADKHREPTLEITGNARHKSALHRREKMRQKLLFAALDVYLISDISKPPVIDDIVRQAGVARGTFYKYFSSLEEILRALGQMLAKDMISTYERLFNIVNNPLTKLAAGPLLSLTHAAMQPVKVTFTAQVDYVDFLSRSTHAREVINHSLQEAQNAGVIQMPSLDCVTDMIIGTTVEGARRLMHTTDDCPSYIRQLTCLILKGCGVSAADAQKAVDEAQAQIHRHAHTLPWWNDET
ncbi:helix-turn-helix domain-containing protein [Halioxenophilus aromaticivorans]